MPQRRRHMGPLVHTCIALSLAACTASKTPEVAGDAGDSNDSNNDDSGTADAGGGSNADEADSGNEGGEDDAQDSEDSGDSDDPTGDDDSGSDDGDETPKFDLGAIPETPPLESGCGKVDFLFVIDNSGSMGDEQSNLKTSFPGFIEAIEVTLDVEDFHVMTINTGPEQGGSSSSSCTGRVCTCSPAPTCCERLCDAGTATNCNGIDCDDLDDEIECYYQLGAGNIDQRVAPWDECDITGGNRFMTSEQDDLITAFECTAALGTLGSSDEKPMLAMGNALSDRMNSVDGCNAGFLRDDAILVVTVITDEEEKGMRQSPGTPNEWYQRVVDAKGGNADAIVMLGLIGDIGQPGSICTELNTGGNNTDGAEASPRLRAFIELFGATHGLEASVCAKDYGPFFEEAVKLIDTTCQDFDPPG